MKILITGINFTPELTGIGKYTGEMAEWLAAKNHDVRVITAPPYYPEWRVLSSHSAWKYSCETEGNLTVFRCPLWVPKKPTGLKRLLHLFSFALSSAPVMMSQIFWRPDIVIVIEPPLLCSPIAWLVAKLSGAKSWLHIQDFELDAAFDLGLLKGVFAKHIALIMESWMLRRFDSVSTISKKMLEKLNAKGVSQKKCSLFPNWVDLRSFEGCKVIDLRKQLGISSGDIVAMYSGNMGGKQGLEVLGAAAHLCDAQFKDPNKVKIIEDPLRIIFIFCGAGAGRDELKSLCGNLSNVHFLDLQPLENLPSLLGMADIHLLPQREEVEDLVMPSKLTGMLASGRPVVASAKFGSELASVVDVCGLFVNPGDSLAFALAIQTLAGNQEMRKSLGAAGRQYAETYLDKEKVLHEFEHQLVSL